MKTEKVLISEISQDPLNARKHSERNIEAIVASLRAFGQQKPIVLDHRNIILAGNGTFEAAKRLGWTEIDVVRTELQGSQAALYAIADNRTAELAEWDMPVLQKQMTVFQQEMLDVSVTGFSDMELVGILPDDSLDLESVESEAERDGSGIIDQNASHVRMVQLFLNTDTLPDFTEYVTFLGEIYGTENATDTVMECLKREHANNQPETD